VKRGDPIRLVGGPVDGKTTKLCAPRYRVKLIIEEEDGPCYWDALYKIERIGKEEEIVYRFSAVHRGQKVATVDDSVDAHTWRYILGIKGRRLP
jgi:hypothetical protein